MDTEPRDVTRDCHASLFATVWFCPNLGSPFSSVDCDGISLANTSHWLPAVQTHWHALCCARQVMLTEESTGVFCASLWDTGTCAGTPCNPEGCVCCTFGVRTYRIDNGPCGGMESHSCDLDLLGMSSASPDSRNSAQDNGRWDLTKPLRF
ncbi:hypothetical protein BKA93DRAFT_27893 [Sparassis latifolia]